MSKVAIIGAGTWGIALANMLCSCKHDVIVWSILEKEIDYIRTYRKHPNLKDTHILEDIKLTTNLKEAIEGNEVVVMAVPSVFVRSTSLKVAEYINSNQLIVDVAKGIEEDTLLTMSEIIFEEINKVKEFPYENIVALSGPTHAEEVSIGLPSTIVSACIKEENARIIQEIFTSPYMRVYTNNDIKGVEVSGALKNIIALASGISHGLGFGDNATAALITRGINEVSRLGIAMGCPIQTFYGLSGIGDLIVTCTSMHSRNFQCGMYIGKGYNVDTAVKRVGMVVEGLNALNAAYNLSVKYNVELPIIKSVYDIVKYGIEPFQAVQQLYNRDKKSELPEVVMEKMKMSLLSDNSLEFKRIMVISEFKNINVDTISFIKKAKQHGDYLIAGLLNSNDNDYSLVQTKEALKSIKYIDHVMISYDIDHFIKDCQLYNIDTIIVSDKEKELINNIDKIEIVVI